MFKINEVAQDDKRVEYTMKGKGANFADKKKKKIYE